MTLESLITIVKALKDCPQMSPLVYGCMPNLKILGHEIRSVSGSVTRLGKVLPLFQNFDSFGQFCIWVYLVFG